MQRLLITVTISWLLLTTIWVASHAQESPTLLGEAVAAGTIELHVAGRSIAYTQPMLEARLSNLSAAPLTLLIPQGQKFEDEQQQYASVIVAQATQLTLEPGATSNLPLLAFSLASDRGFPAPSTHYRPNGVETDPALLALLQRIETEAATPFLAAQIAVWMQRANSTDFETFTANLGTTIDLQPQRSLTLKLLGQPVGWTEQMMGTAVLAIGLPLAILLALLLRRSLHKTFDGYRITGHIATGVKYHIRHAEQRNGDRLAIKEPIDNATENRCLREIEIREQIGQEPPHIVPLLASGYYSADKQGRARPYLVETYIDGADLSKVLAERSKLGTTIALEMMGQLITALGYLHERYQIIHRELQPSNILIDRRGELWLTDFSSAIDPHQAEFVRVQRNEHSTHFWLAPEMVARKRALYFANGQRPEPDPLLKARSADIFSLGVLLYQLTLGQPPFAPASSQQLFAQPKPQLANLATLEPALAAIIRRCLDPNPTARFQTVMELEQALGLPLPIEQSRQARAELGRLVQDLAVKTA